MEMVKTTIKTPGVIQIDNCGLYVKSPEALALLIKELEEQGYIVEDSSKGDEYDRRPPREEQEKKGWSLWFARLKDDIAPWVAKCSHCGSYIERTGVGCHMHRCEACGKVTHLEYVKGRSIRFMFAKDAGGAGGCRDVEMRLHGYDMELELLLLQPKPLDEGRSFFTARGPEAVKILWDNRSQYRAFAFGKPTADEIDAIRKLVIAGDKDAAKAAAKKSTQLREIDVDTLFEMGDNGVILSEAAQRALIAIPHVVHQGVQVINTCEIERTRSFYKSLRLYQGVEYGEFDNLPMETSFSIYEAWHWAPLSIPNDTLYKKILSAASMVSDAGYYHQDGSREFYGRVLGRMRLFVEHFTTIPLEDWDAFIRVAPMDGPGMVKSLAAFCQGKSIEEATYENRPNICNMIDGIYSFKRHGHLLTGEMEAMAAVVKDKGCRAEFEDLLRHFGK